MDAHTPKREAIEKFIHHESKSTSTWMLRARDAEHEPIVRLEASRDDQPGNQLGQSLEIHTRQVRLEDDEIDEATKTLIRRWLASLDNRG